MIVVGRLKPIRASVRTRSAIAAAVVMMICLVLASGALLLVLYRSLESTAQNAAAARADQISTQLRTDSPRDVDSSLLATDSQIGAVQIVDVWHAQEHVWEVAQAVFGRTTPEGVTWAKQGCTWLAIH